MMQHLKGSRIRGRLQALPLVLSLLGVLVSSGPALAQGVGRHVATTGSDSNPGTAAAPFRSVQAATDVALPGDTILIHAGTYDGVVETRHSGTSVAPIRMQPAGDGAVVLRASLPPRACTETAPTGDRTLKFAMGADYWIVRDLEVVGGILVSGNGFSRVNPREYDRSIPGHGLYDPAAAGYALESVGADGADHFQILNNKVRGRGIRLTLARSSVVSGNEVYDVDCGTGPGILLGEWSSDNRVANNYVHDVAASAKHWMSEGIRLAAASMYNVFEDNLIERLGGPGRGITADGQSGWNIIRRNTVRNADQGFSEQKGAWGNQWRRNVAENNRKFGFNLYADGDPGNDVPLYVTMRCNKSLNNPTAFNVGRAEQSRFNANGWSSVSISGTARTQWAADGNLWDNQPVPPPSNPSTTAYSTYCSGME